MRFVNHPDSQNDVLTTIAPVVDAFLKALKVEMPNTGFVYDPELTYETSVKNLRDDEFYNNDSNVQSPLFSFRRTILRNVDDFAQGKRLPYQKIVNSLNDSNNPTILAACMGRFEFEFIYYTRSALASEQFEVANAANRGVSGIRKLDVNLGDDLGNFEYILNHEPLSEITVNHQGNYYKAISGIAFVHGIYLMFESKGSIINTITSRINNFIDVPKDGINLSTEQINS